MKNNLKTYNIFILCLIFYVTFEQIKVPLLHKKLVLQQQETNHRRHNLMSQAKVQHRYSNRTSKLSHNLKYIHQQFQKYSQDQFHKPKSHNHHLQFHQTETSHLKLQSFKLQPNVYSFSLPMNIGGYDYDMSIDSGSSDIFIKGQKSKGKPKKRYHCGDVCIQSNDKYTIGYLDGELKTYETKLEVKLGQHVFNQSILVAYKADQNFDQNQGLVGLSFQKLSTNPNPTFIQTLINEKIIDHYGFGVNLNFQDKDRSFITFGSYDPQFFQGELSMFPLISQLFYNINSKGVSVGNGELLSIKTAIFDTGNTCISIPTKHKDSILKKFNVDSNSCYFSVERHAQMFSVLRCKVGNFDALPTLNIHLGDKIFPVEKQFYMQACDRRPKDEKSPPAQLWYCDMYIQSVQGMNELFLGDGFFNRYYTYFDLQNKQIGIAKNKQNISLSKIQENKLDVNEDEWIEILSKLNRKQSKSDIKKQLQKGKQSQRKTI